MANRRRGPVTNRRHLARQERERLQNRAITIGSIVIVGLVVALIGYGLIVSKFIEPKQPVASVNGEEILTREFQSRVFYQRIQLVSQWNQLANLLTSFGISDQNTASFFVSQMNQIEFQLDPTTIGRSILNELVADRLIRQEAAARGITVTEEELNTAVEEFFSYYGGGYAPTPTPAPSAVPTSTLTPLQMTLTAPTATPVVTATQTLTDTGTITDTQTLTDTQTVTDTGTLTDTGTITNTEGITSEVTATPTVTITATPLPTPTAISFESFQDTKKAYLEQLKVYGITEADLRYFIESQLYRDKLRADMTQDISPFQDQVWARHILVATEDEAKDVLARLEAGEDFASLATELSTDQASAVKGGDLGWFGLGTMVQEFEKVAFNLQVGEISEPVQSQFGWHIIQVLGHEKRALTPDEYEQLKDTEFEGWISQQRLSADVQLFDRWANRVPTEPGVPAGGAQALLQQLQSVSP